MEHENLSEKYLIERTKRRWRQQDVAEKTGLTQNKISEIERGVIPKKHEKDALDKVFQQ
jgi:transcriptional regulator with XRE-family HTH domain